MIHQAGDAATDTHVCQNADTRETGPDQHHQLAMADHGILNSRPAPAKKKAAGYAQYGGSAAGIQSLIESEPDHNVRQKIGAYISVARNKGIGGTSLEERIASAMKRHLEKSPDARAKAWETDAVGLSTRIKGRRSNGGARAYSVPRNRAYKNYVEKYLLEHVSLDQAKTYLGLCTTGGGRHPSLIALDAAIWKAFREIFPLSEEDKDGKWRGSRMTMSKHLNAFLKRAAPDARRLPATELDYLAAAASQMIYESEAAADQPGNTLQGTLIASSSALEGGCAGASPDSEWTEFIDNVAAPHRVG